MNVHKIVVPPIMGHSHIAYRPDIDGLRAIAVLAVVAFHYFPGRLPGGFVGVDVFFVISGYLITRILVGSLQKGTFSFAGFYSRRIRRIFPALLVILAASFVLGWFVLMPMEFKQLGEQIVAAAFFVANFLFWSQSGYFDNPLEKPLLHLWSLSIEEQFYVVWPMLLWFAWNRKWPLLPTIAAVTLASFATNIVVTTNDPVAGFYSPLTRAWELGLGALLACSRAPMEGQSYFGSRRGLSMVGLLMIGGTTLLLDKEATFPGWWAAVPVLGACFVIIAGPGSFLNRKLLSLPPLVWIGLISYPLYLWHWVLLTFARSAVDHELTAVHRIGLILLSVLLADLTCRLVEKPIRFGGVGRVKIAALTASLVLLAVIGGQAWRNNGFPIRYKVVPGAIAERLDTVSKRATDARTALLTYRYNHTGNALRDKCWITTKTPTDWFVGRGCLPSSKSRKPRVLIWGDSHAARLYPGLKLDRTLKVGLVARDICTATLKAGTHGDGNDKKCLESNKTLLSLIEKNPPDVVILFSAWYHQHYYGEPKALLKGVAEMARKVKEAGVRRVIVAGPTPHWEDDLPKVVYKHWENLSPPRRLDVGLQENAVKLDRMMREKSWPRGVEFFSMMDSLCDDEGCLTYVPDLQELTSYNYGHLTIPAGAYVTQKMNLHRH